MDDIFNTRARSADSAEVPLRIFLVEDSADVRELIVESLVEIDGVSLVGHAETEQEALEHLEDNAYDVLVLDIQLRQGNGMSLLQSLDRGHARRAGEVKVVFSNHVSPTYRNAGKQCGVAHFFDKSSELPLLCNLLERLAREKLGVRNFIGVNTPPVPAQSGGL